jgi:Uma2 family endonuclease
MATTTTLGPYTVADLERRREEGNERYELIDGKAFVVPSPDLDHQGIVVRLAHHFSAEVEERGLGRVCVAPIDTRFSQVRDVQPDLIVVRHGASQRSGGGGSRGSRRSSGRSSRRPAAPTIASASARSMPTRASPSTACSSR